MVAKSYKVGIAAVFVQRHASASEAGACSADAAAQQKQSNRNKPPSEVIIFLCLHPNGKAGALTIKLSLQVRMEKPGGQQQSDVSRVCRCPGEARYSRNAKATLAQSQDCFCSLPVEDKTVHLLQCLVN